jgi:hypothetical protein
VFRAVGQRPVLAVLVGAVAIAFSGILFRLSQEKTHSWKKAA